MTKTELPWWLTVIIIIEILPMFFGPLLALNNPRFMGGPEATIIGFAAYIYSARNIAVGLAFILAFVLKSAPMLFILIVVRLLTDIVDLPSILAFGLATNEARVIAIFVFFYYVPAVFALRYLWRETQPRTVKATP